VDRVEHEKCTAQGHGKFESGTGWPGFYEPVREDALEFRRDWSMLVPCIKVRCATCGSHLGHVFDDGLSPRGSATT